MLLEELVVDQHRCRLRYIQTGQLHQFKRSHAEAADVAHHAIDINKVGPTFINEVRSFEREAATDLIDQKTGRIGQANRFARHAFADHHQRFGNPVFGLQAVDDFNQFHQRNRIEEMESRKTLRRFQLGGDGRHRHRRRIGRQDAICADNVFQFAEKRAFGIEVFHNRFNDHVAGLELCQRLSDLDPGSGCFGVSGRHAALLRSA